MRLLRPAGQPSSSAMGHGTSEVFASKWLVADLFYTDLPAPPPMMVCVCVCVCVWTRAANISMMYENGGGCGVHRCCHCMSSQRFRRCCC